MRVILVNKFHYRKGGAETYYLTLGEQLEAMGHDVAYFSMRHPQNLPCAQERFFVTQREYNDVRNPLKAIRDGVALVYSLEARSNFQALCEDFRPDVVHLNNVHRQITLSILDAPYLREHRVPVVYTAHDYVTVCPGYLMLDGEGKVCEACLQDGRYRHCVERRCVKGSWAKSALAALEASFNRAHRSNDRIDVAIAPSEFMAKKLVQGGWPEVKVRHMQNFVSGDVYARAVAGNSDRTDHERPYALFFGRISREKGIDTLIDAYGQILPRLPEGSRLVIAGDGPEREALEAKANDRIEFVGYKSGQELRDLVSGATLACCPSVWYENMPYSVVEALAEGTPVVGSNIDGIPEAVIEGETGWLAEPGDAGSLAEALMRGFRVAVSRNTYCTLQQRCRNYVLKSCDQRQYSESLTRLYGDLIESVGGECSEMNAETLRRIWEVESDPTDRERPYLVYFGRLSREKGVDVLIEAFALAASRLPGWRLVIVGDGPDRIQFEAQAAESPAANRIEFVGFQNGRDLERYVRGAALAVCPSVCRENMPYSVVEAFASGTPVVASRIGGIPEIISEGETGFLAEPRNVASLCAAILSGASLGLDRLDYARASANCREYVRRCCDQGRYMQEIVNLYQELIDGKRS